ncbi:MAG: dTMP kinase [Chitinivibrionales bacterium]|nr:dTMP kinase [Chitinivibrionales bacterium]MBD3394069.1 dTMP kinase [Chitinivibrionales bacterium]
MAGLFITFEGIDGCGKSTQLRAACSHVEGKGFACVTTREPGGTPIGENIRELLLSREYGEMCNAGELLLYLAARAQHVAEKIRPAIASGAVVLCDRFQEATFAYQGYGRGYDVATLERLNEFATAGLAPDHTFVFDVSVPTGQKRLRQAGKEPDRLEGGAREFHERTREGYRALARAHPERMSLLDAERPAEKVAGDVAAVLDGLFARRKP